MLKKEPGPTSEKLSDNKKKAYQKNNWKPGYNAQENKDICKSQVEASASTCSNQLFLIK